MKYLLILCLLCTPAFAQERYVVTLKIKQSHFTLDLWEHVKDAGNAITLEIPVDKEFYDSVHVGQTLDQSFRTASLLIRGSWGSWNVSIAAKKTTP